MKIKKLLPLILAIVLVFTLAACGGEEEVPDDPNTLVIGDYTARFNGAQITVDSEGDDAIVLNFGYHNGGEEANSFEWSYFYKAMQGDAELEYAVVWVSEDSYDTLDEGAYEDVAPGATKDIALTFKLVDKTTPVVFNVSDLMDEEKDSITVDLAKATPLVQETTEGAPLAPATEGIYIMTHSESENPEDVIDAETIELLKEMGMPMYIELRSDGTGTFMLDEAYEITWGDGIATLDGEDANYTVDGDTFILYDDETSFYFVLGDYADLEATVPMGSEDFWLGDWYGWWTIIDGTGYYEEHIGNSWDCCAYIESYYDDYLLTIWDTDFNDYLEDPLSEVVIELSGLLATTENGVAISKDDADNFFWAGSVGEGEWYLDPGFLGDDDTIMISSEYVDSDGDSLSYIVTLTKWPSEWNTDIAAAPEYYESFFLPLMEEGGELPVVFEP